ncbi:MAG: hypothetical protein J3Q66DRAFT_384770 [Benniella sp.]|nr:MAG: hypothetical protein J3Q66DRAFT_384770 [Benniella sp.]
MSWSLPPTRTCFKVVFISTFFITAYGFLQIYFYTNEKAELRIPQYSVVDAGFESQKPLVVPITIVTAVSGNHACALEAFLYHLNTTLSRLWTSPTEDARMMKERIRKGTEYVATSQDLENIRLKVKSPKRKNNNGISSGYVSDDRNNVARNKVKRQSRDDVMNDRVSTPQDPGYDSEAIDTIYEIRPKIIVYNMGMGPSKRKKRRFKALIEAGYIDEPIDFDFEKYPDFWRLGTETRGEYGWKAGMINEVTQKILATSPGAKRQQSGTVQADQRNQQPEIVLWLDSGDRISIEFLRWLPSFMRLHGLWTPQSQDNMGTWTHPGLLRYYNDSLDDFENETNCNGAAISFDVRNETVRDGIFKEWVQCAMTKECIAPDGSSRENHRQDQAALTYLVKTMGYRQDLCHGLPDVFSIQVNQDRYCKDDIAANPNRVISI